MGEGEVGGDGGGLGRRGGDRLFWDVQINGSVRVMSDNLEPMDCPGIEPGKQRDRSPKPGDQKYEAVSIRLNPQGLLWAKAEGNSRSGRLR